MERGEVWWAQLPDPSASEPGYRRPVVIIQSDSFNRSRIRTVIAVVLTSNLHLAEAPGNLLISASESGLPRDSVANVSRVITVDWDFLIEKAGACRAKHCVPSRKGFGSCWIYNPPRRIHPTPGDQSTGKLKFSHQRISLYNRYVDGLLRRHAAIGPADRRRLDPDQDLACFWFRFRHLPERQDIRRSVACVDNRLHNKSLHLLRSFRNHNERPEAIDPFQ